MEGRDVQVLHRPRARGQDPRRRRAVPQPAREGRRRLHRREDPDPSARPDRADPAPAARDPEKQTHDYKRNGTTTLFAALEVATGLVTDRCFQQHTNVEFLAFLKQVAKAYPRVQLHVVCDNYATHKHDNVKAWLVKNPRVHLHFTPTGGSWLNMVEIFFGIITRQAIRRGTFHSVADLEAAIAAYIDGWNERAHPFSWTKSADEIVAHAKPSPHRKKSYNTRH
ncbi:MAG TPA: IS630 family transposase [Mycobacterium sp.]